MFVNSEGLIVYFEYDMSETNVTRRVGSAYQKEFDFYDAYRDVDGTNTKRIISHYFNYTDGSLTFLDSENELARISPIFQYSDDRPNDVTSISLVVQPLAALKVELLMYGSVGQNRFKTIKAYDDLMLLANDEYRDVAQL